MKFLSTFSNEEKLIVAGLLLFFFFVIPSFLLVPPYFEAQSYNRITGENVSYWDALWVELRVQSCDK